MNFAKLVSKALEYAGNVPSEQEIAAALVLRGYTTSDMDAYAAATPPEPVIQLPAAPPPATVRRVSITMPPIQTRIAPPPPPTVVEPTIPLPARTVVQALTPIPALPEAPAATQAPAVEPASDSKWMFAVLIGAFLLKNQAA